MATLPAKTWNVFAATKNLAATSRQCTRGRQFTKVMETLSMAMSENKPLNKKLPYGTIRGRLEGFPQARYSQEDRLYNAREELIYDGSAHIEPELPPELPPAPEVPPAPPVEPPVPDAPPAPPVEPPAPPAPPVEPPAPPAAPKAEKAPKAPKAPKLPGLPTKD